MDAELLDPLVRWGAPPLIVLAATAGAVWVLLRTIPQKSSTRIFRQLSVVGLVLSANVVVVLALPIGTELRGQLLSLFGLALTAIIALSSTTLVANAMAGLMLRAVGSFHPGDYVLVEQHFGRVTEQGLLHTEVQSEDRDLITLPNLYLISHPVKVVSRRGTLVSADVSLGYDVPRVHIESALLGAAERAGLADAFVQIKALQDHAVSYRVSGFLEDVGSLVSKRTDLNGAVLDSLHGAGIEIVSPDYMNQRRLAADTVVIPRDLSVPVEPASRAQPEQMMFDKAEIASRLERLHEQREDAAAALKTLEQGGPDNPQTQAEIAWHQRQIDSLDGIIDALEKS